MKKTIKYSRHAAMSGKGWQVGRMINKYDYIVDSYHHTWIDALYAAGASLLLTGGWYDYYDATYAARMALNAEGA